MAISVSHKKKCFQPSKMGIKLEKPASETLEQFLKGFSSLLHVNSHQGDQMSLVKPSPTRQPSTFLSKLIRNLFCVNEWSKVWAAFQNFKNLPEVNKRPMGKNSPNLVALIHTLTMLA
jgi:hypothetical protein